MAHDAINPDPTATDPDAPGAEPEPSSGPAPRRRHAARAVSGDTDTHASAWPPIAYYMAFGVTACLFVLSSVFPFNAVVGDMNRQGWIVTAIVAIALVMLLASAASCLRSRCYSCVWESLVVAVVLVGNWTCWLLNLSIVHWIGLA